MQPHTAPIVIKGASPVNRYVYLITAVTLVACTRGNAAPTPVETAAVERRTIIVDAQATGVVEPINVVEVKSKSSGQIVRMPVDVGSEVRTGDLLVQLDTRDVKNQYDQAAADLRAAQARLEVAAAQRRRSNELHERQIITRQELEASSLEFENAQAQVIRTRSSVDLAQQRLEEATVRAPVAGTVIEKPVSLGQVITSATGSASGGTTILRMADLKQVRMRALVNETDIGSIRPGMQARVVVDAYPNRPFWGVVEKVEPQAIVQQSVTMFPVLVSLNNDEGLLMPGMNGEVGVEVARREGVLAVPTDAIRTMREVPGIAVALGLNPDSAQAQLRAQMMAGRGPGAPTAAGADSTPGQQVRVAQGDVDLAPQQGGPRQGGPQQGGPSGRQGGMPQVTDEQCAPVRAAVQRNPQAQQQLQGIRERMMSGQGDPQALREEMQRIYASVGVDPRIAGACLRRQGGGAAGGAPQAPGAGAQQSAAAQGPQRSQGSAMDGSGRPGQPGAQPMGAGQQQGGFGGMGGGGGAMRSGRGGASSGVVFVAQNGTYIPRMVRLGVSDFDYTEVMGGVQEGEQVALLAVAALQAQRAAEQERIRSRMGGGVPGMRQQQPSGTSAPGAAPGGGARPPGGR